MTITEGAIIILTAILTCLARDIYEWVKRKGKKPKNTFDELDKKVDLMLDAQLCSTRKDLIHECNKYLERGEIPIYALDNITKMYKAYHNLGGNGTITALVEEIKELPIQH